MVCFLTLLENPFRVGFWFGVMKIILVFHIFKLSDVDPYHLIKRTSYMVWKFFWKCEFNLEFLKIFASSSGRIFADKRGGCRAILCRVEPVSFWSSLKTIPCVRFHPYRFTRVQKYSPKIRCFNKLNKINPSVPAAPKWRISTFEKKFGETERS